MENTKPMLKCNSSNNNGGSSSEASKLPESPRLPMEFLSRSWSLSALQLSKALSHSLPSLVSKSGMMSSCATPPIMEEEYATAEEEAYTHSHFEDFHNNKQRLSFAGNSFSFASSVTSQLVLERIMNQSEVSPLTSGRPSCSEPLLPLGNGGQSCGSITDQLPLDSPSLSPPHHHDFDFKFLSYNSTPRLQIPTGPTNPNGGVGNGGGKTVGRWLKERREKKKEEARVQNAQLHAAVSVAAVASAVAATAAATATASASAGKDEQAALTDVAMVSAATLVAARCVEAAEALGAEHHHLASVISSAVNVQSHGDIITLTAAAATALRGAATLKARAMKEACNIAAVLPVAVEKGLGIKAEKNGNCFTRSGHNSCGSSLEDQSFIGLCNEELLARGSELLKRTRTGDFHWKLVSVYPNKEGQVILKMKSRHVAGALTKKKKKVLMEVCSNMAAWPERYHVESGEDRCYFGLKTATNRVIQFECKNQKEHDIWTQGVSRLLSLAREKCKVNMRSLSIGSS